MGRRIVWGILLVLLGMTGALGLYNGINEWGDAQNRLQQSVTAAVLLYGVAGVAATYALAMRRRWAIWAAVAWSIGTTWAGTVAVVAYGGEEASSIGVVAAGCACLLIAAAMIWGVRAQTR